MVGVILGFYGDSVGVILGLYWDDGKENGNYHNGAIKALGFKGPSQSSKLP